MSTSAPQKISRIADRDAERSVISSRDLRSKSTKTVFGVSTTTVLVLLGISGLFPLLWLVMAATSTAQAIVVEPFSIWPQGFHPENLVDAWVKVRVDQYTFNTIAIAVGVTIAALTVATTGGYVLAILKPKYAGILNLLIMATLFIPGIISLVPLYEVIVDVPILHVRLIDTFWAVWLPSGVSAFNILIVKQYFQSLPAELFEAAKIDGAGPLRSFFAIVLPLSKPIIGVIALLTFTAAWKDFLWPLLALPSKDNYPLSVALYYSEKTMSSEIALSAMLIASILPLALVLIFQNQFLKGAGTAGAVKG